MIDANVQRFSESAGRHGRSAILVEGPSRKDADELMGRTECNRIVNFDGPNARLVGQMIDVRITQALAAHAARRGGDDGLAGRGLTRRRGPARGLPAAATVPSARGQSALEPR